MRAEVISMRRHCDLSLDQALRIQESLIVPCPPPAAGSRKGRGLGRGRGCGAPAGQRCVSLATGLPLSGLGAHVDRLEAARTARAPRSGPAPSPRTAPDPTRRELATA